MSNEIKLGSISIARIEEMHGPVMPTDQFFPDMPEQAWCEFQEVLAPDHGTNNSLP